MKDQYLKLFECIKFTKGYNRSLGSDTQRRDLFCIPNSLMDFISADINKFSVSEIYNVYSDDKPVVDEYIDFLLNNEICFLCDKGEPDLFPPMSTEWDFPSDISNAIIDISSTGSYDLKNVLLNLDRMRCFHLEVLAFNHDRATAGALKQIMKFVETSSIRTVSLVTDHDLYREIQKTAISFKKLSRILVFSSDQNLIEKQGHIQMIYTEKNITAVSCGVVHKDYFSNTVEHINESLSYNTCLNRKLCIDQEGYIKNCPNMVQHHGHISTTDIAEVVKLPEFQQWWHIRKDDIDVCRDCEFRHLCTDCRALIKDPGNVYSQPAKCTYNPYICKWAGEEGYVPVEECGTYSRETGFVPDEGKISKLNKAIWGDG